MHDALERLTAAAVNDLDEVEGAKGWGIRDPGLERPGLVEGPCQGPKMLDGNGGYFY